MVVQRLRPKPAPCMGRTWVIVVMVMAGIMMVLVVMLMVTLVEREVPHHVLAQL